MFEVLDGELDPEVRTATHAVTSSGQIRRFAAAMYRGEFNGRGVWSFA